MEESDRVGLHCAYKPLLATVCALLVEDGKLSYDDNPFALLGVDLSQDKVHPHWRAVTLRH